MVKPRCIGFNGWLNPSMLYLLSCQTLISLSSADDWTQVFWVWHIAKPTLSQVFLGLVDGWIQICWVWRLTKPKFPWVQLMAKPRCIGFNGWLNPSMLYLLSCQTLISLSSADDWTQVFWVWHIAKPTLSQVFLGLVDGWIQICWVWRLTKPKFPWVQLMAKPKCIGFNGWLNPSMLYLLSCQTLISLSSTDDWTQVF
jgi:UDP-N-acetylmuramyl pentapeptide phosphotransferase/UDP-N-acetylglucosamine-1-phosphate transferase